jgi:hypothetical protein
LAAAEAAAAEASSSSSSSSAAAVQVAVHGLPAAAGPAVRVLVVQGAAVVADQVVHLQQQQQQAESTDLGLTARWVLNMSCWLLVVANTCLYMSGISHAWCFTQLSTVQQLKPGNTFKSAVCCLRCNA